MKYYKRNGSVFAFESDGSQDHLIQPGDVMMTLEDVDRHINPLKYMTVEQRQEAYITSVKTLNRRDFKSMFVCYDFDLDEIESIIKSIDDKKSRSLMMLDWNDGDEYKCSGALMRFLCKELSIDFTLLTTMWEYALDNQQ